MIQKFVVVIFLLLTVTCFMQAQDAAAIENLSSVKLTFDYAVRNSKDNYGNLYIRAWSYHPSILTFVDSDGSVTVCTSDESAKVTYIYEYSANLEEKRTLTIENELAQLGAFTKDNDGNFYFFYAVKVTSRSIRNMAMVKYDRNCEKINTFKLTAGTNNSFNGIKIPFDAGTCRLELSGSLLAVYFAREMFDGHQASYGFVLDKDTFARIDTGAATNADPNGRISQMPYTSHSFNQFILPIENGFIFADHGDAHPRSFTFAKFIRDRSTKRVHAFRFPGGSGANATYAQMGGLAKTSAGFLFSGTYGRVRENPRNLFILTFDNDMDACSDPVYLTNYTVNDGHAGHPKLVSLNNGRYLLMWEKFRFSTQSANIIITDPTGYLSTFAMIINEKGEALSEVQELKGIRLNMNDTLRYNPRNRKVYWAVNDTSNSIIIYGLDINFQN